MLLLDYQHSLLIFWAGNSNLVSVLTLFYLPLQSPENLQK